MLHYSYRIILNIEKIIDLILQNKTKAIENGGSCMIYPIFTYNDGTEVTASKRDSNGKVSLYIERFDTDRDMFVNATILIPQPVVVSSTGYSEKELDSMLQEFSKIQDDIIEYVADKEKKSA